MRQSMVEPLAVTVLAHTADAPEVLARSLLLVASGLRKAEFLVVDTSASSAAASANARLCETNAARYVRIAGLTPAPIATLRALDVVTTGLVVQYDSAAALVPDGLEAAADFLLGHPEYAVAFGHETFAEATLDQRPAPSGLDGGLIERLFAYAQEGAFPLWYAVQRASHLKVVSEALSSGPESPDEITTQLVTDLAPLLFGKARALNVPFLSWNTLHPRQLQQPERFCRYMFDKRFSERVNSAKALLLALAPSAQYLPDLIDFIVAGYVSARMPSAGLYRAFTALRATAP